MIRLLARPSQIGDDMTAVDLVWRNAVVPKKLAMASAGFARDKEQGVPAALKKFWKVWAWYVFAHGRRCEQKLTAK
jgi:hypothetical protein